MPLFFFWKVDSIPGGVSSCSETGDESDERTEFGGAGAAEFGRIWPRRKRAVASLFYGL